MSKIEDDVGNGQDNKSFGQGQREDEGAVAAARAIILQRRNAFMAAALAGMGAAMTDCGSSVCLSLAPPDAEVEAPKDAGPSVCLSMDARPNPDLPVPRVCLSFEPPDAGGDATGDGGGDAQLDGNSDGSPT